MSVFSEIARDLLSGIGSFKAIILDLFEKFLDIIFDKFIFSLVILGTVSNIDYIIYGGFLAQVLCPVIIVSLYSLLAWCIKSRFVCKGKLCYYKHLSMYTSLWYELLIGSITSLSLSFIAYIARKSIETKYFSLVTMLILSAAIVIITVFSRSSYRHRIIMKEAITDTYNYVTFIYIFIVSGFVFLYLFAFNVFDLEFVLQIGEKLVAPWLKSSLFNLMLFYSSFFIYLTLLWIIVTHYILLNITWSRTLTKKSEGVIYENKLRLTRQFNMNSSFKIIFISLLIFGALISAFFMYNYLQILIILLAILSLPVYFWFNGRKFAEGLVDAFFLGLYYSLPIFSLYVSIIYYRYPFEVSSILFLRVLTGYLLVVLITEIAIFGFKRNFPITEIYRVVSRPLFIIMVIALAAPLLLTLYFDNIINQYLFVKSTSINLQLIFVRSVLAYSSIISATNILLAEIYYTDKHMEERLNEYLRRFIDKLVSTTPPVGLLRFIIVGYGDMGKRLVKGLFQHEIVRLDNPDSVDIMLLSDKTTGAPRLVKYALCVKNVILVDRSYNEWYRTISHPIVGTVGLELVEYGYDERVYVPVIKNDITNDNTLNYIKLIGEWTSSPIESIPKTVLLLAISDLDSLIRFLAKIKQVGGLRNTMILYRVLSSQQLTHFSKDTLLGNVYGIYLDYIIGYHLGTPFTEFLNISKLRRDCGTIQGKCGGNDGRSSY